MEALLRIRANKCPLNKSVYENAMEIFLSEYPNGDIRTGKRRAHINHPKRIQNEEED